MSVEATLMWLVKNLWVLLVGAFGWIFRTQNEKIKLQDLKIEALEKAQRDFITSDDARRMIAEIIEPIRTEQKEVKSDVKDILIAVHEIQKNLAVQAAIYKLQHEHKE